MTDILVYTEEQGNVIAGSVQPDRIVVAVLGAVGAGGSGGGAVSSVNGQIGHVVLDAADVGADPAGTGASAAAAAVAAHEVALDPHSQYTTAVEAAAAAPVQSVNGETGAVVLSAADVGADVAGAAAAAAAAHVADTTPHDVITQVDKFGFDTAAGQTAGVGEMVWNAADGTVDLGLPGGVTLQVGQEQLIRVLNKTGSTIQNMHVVYITGAQGNRVTAAQAQANSVNADKTLAVATQDIANNAEGFATIMGMVRHVNTSAWAEGTELWLSVATPGAITNVRPSAPNHQVRVGYVVRSHATEGVIYVTVNIGADLGHLHDVVITAPADNDILIYDSATQTWQNGPQTGGSGAVDSVNGQTGVVVLDTDDVAEGASNLYFTNARASAAAPVQSVNGQTGAVDLSGSYAPLSHVGSGGTAHANVVAGGAAGFMTGADKTKLDGIASGATANADTDSLAEGATNKYFTEPRVRNTVLTGLSLLAGGAITAADSVLSALGRLQKQISDAITAIGGKQDTLVSGTSLKTVNGNSLLGAGDISITAGAPLAQVVEYTGTAKTLALADNNTIVDCTSTSAVTITIPPQSSVTWTADAEIHVRMSGTGTVRIAVGSGVTIPPMAAPIALSGQGAIVTLKRRSADVWAVVGSISTVGLVTSSLDSVTVSGDYKADAAAIGSPVSSLLGHNAIYQGDASFGTMFAIGYDSARAFLRRLQSGAWSSWSEIWTSRGNNLIAADTGSIGFGTGSGSTVTQATSKSTGVTLNKPSGQITMNGAALAANTAVSFTLTNSAIAANDVPKVVIKSGATAGAYVLTVDAVAAGSCRISVRNMTAGSLSEALVLQFGIEKGAIA